VIEEHGDWWPAFYARGMNHLHWPWALAHTDDAVADFRRCLELQRAAEESGDAFPGYARTWILLGDALVKLGEVDEAREVWSEGARRHPGTPELQERLALPGDEELEAFVAASRSLEAPIDTDFSFLGSAFD
jgi:hypothetical protein